MTLNDLSKRIAAQLKLKSTVVRAVLESRQTDLPGTTVARIADTARDLIHEELLRLDAQHHPQDSKPAPRRGETAAPRRSR